MSQSTFTITKVDNGYQLVYSWRNEVFKTLDEVFAVLLLSCEGRASSFGGNMYGTVKILRDKEQLVASDRSLMEAVLARNPDILSSIIIDDMKKNGPLWHKIKGMKLYERVSGG